MSEYAVIRKADGAEVDRYSNDTPVEWPGMEFATHDHVPLLADGGGAIEAMPVRVFTKLEYLRRFTPTERIAIRDAAVQSPVLADYLYLLDLAEEVRSDDPDIGDALGMLEQAGLLAAGRAGEILNGN